MKTCKFCDYVRMDGRVCVHCGGLDDIAPLSAYKKLGGIDKGWMESLALRLKSNSSDSDTVLLRAIVELNLNNWRGALPGTEKIAGIPG